MTTLIAGGGLAGAAAACLLGPEATLIERERGPHDKICGEFISWEAQAALVELGIRPAQFGAAPIGAVRLVHGARSARAELPGLAAGLSRRILDEAVLCRAVANGATVLRGHAVRALTPHGLLVAGLGEVAGSRILLATGKHDLRGARRRARPSTLVGLKTSYRLAAAQAAALGDHVEVILFRGGYAGLQPVEDGNANLCLLIDRSAFEGAGATWPGVLAHLADTVPHLSCRLAGATPLGERPVAISGVPYGFVHDPSPADSPHVLRLGDQMGVIPSFSGDGMAIALYTARAAAHARGPADYHARMRRDLAGQIGRATVLHRLGLSHPRLVAGAARAWPGALRWIARLTRAPALSPR